MRLLILTQYYPPEIGAPQNRLHELAIRLKEKGIHIEVLTAMPNYPKMEIMYAYKDGKIKEEIIDGIIVHRASIFVSKSKSIVKRLLNYFSFVFTSYLRGRKLPSFDYLMVESPPLFLGYSAMALSNKLNAKLIFNVSDLWPESAEKLDLVTNKMMLKFAYQLEAKCYGKSYLITGQTNGIVESIKTRFPSKDVYWLPNGVDLNYYNPDNLPDSTFRNLMGFDTTDLLIFYGGIIGYAQGLDVILNAAKILKDEKSIKFILQGSGPEKERLLLLKEDLQLTNIYFLPPVDKKEMPNVLMGIDLAVVPLRKLELFQGAIPSKIFESLAMKTPLLLGVDGEARAHFITKAEAGLYFEPENANELATCIMNFYENRSLITQMGNKGRIYVDKYFNRNNIAQNLFEKLNK
jgi:glycosyltransferase involved in cell wall biosynthesis